MFYILIICDNNNENNFIIYKFDHRRKFFAIIKIFSLFEISNALTCFVFNFFVVNFLKNFNCIRHFLIVFFKDKIIINISFSQKLQNKLKMTKNVYEAHNESKSKRMKRKEKKKIFQILKQWNFAILFSRS